MLYDKRWEKTDNVVTDPVKDLLLRTAAFYENGGEWYQGNYAKNNCDPNSPVCMMGAMNKQMYGNPIPPHQAEYALINDALKRLVMHLRMWVPDWNDYRAKTKDQVIAAFKAAAELPTPNDREYLLVLQHSTIPRAGLSAYLVLSSNFEPKEYMF